MKTFFKKTIDWIKNLFASPVEPEKQPDKKTIEHYIPTLNKDVSLSIFNSAKPGDIIYGPTSYKPSVLEKLEVSHRVRPYIVLRSEVNHLVGFCGTSDIRTDYKLVFKLNKDNYHVSKDGIIDLSSLRNINSTAIVSKVDHLTATDMFKINQIVYASNIDDKEKHMFDMSLSLKPGMIISESYSPKLLFLIYKIDDTNITLYRLNKDKSSNISLKFNGIRYYINEKEPATVQKDLNCVVLSMNELNTVKTIKYKLDRKKTVSHNKKNDTYEVSHYFKYDIGQVFVVGMQTFVYLFSCHNEDYAIEIYEDESISDLQRIEKYGDYMNKDGMLEKDEILDVVSETAERNKRCKWLYEYVLNLYGSNTSKEVEENNNQDIECSNIIESKDTNEI